MSATTPCHGLPRPRPHRVADRPPSGDAAARAHARARASTSSAPSAVMPAACRRSSRRTTRGPSTSSAARARSVWDVDGNEYLDFHNGFGVMCVGHANPVDRRRRQGADGRGHALRRARPRARSSSPRSCAAAGASRTGASRTPAPSRRWTRSTSRAALTGRDMIVKIEGTYHGHHDAVMVSVKPPADADGRPRAARTRSPTASATPRRRPSTRASSRSTTPTALERCSTSSTARWPA